MANFLLSIFWVLLLTVVDVTSVNQGVRVYVNNMARSSSRTCGTKNNPCKLLQAGVFKAMQSGATVILQGKHIVHSQIYIHGSISISGEGKALIKGTSKVVFNISQLSQLHLNNIRFEAIAVAYVSQKSHISVTNCQVYGKLDAYAVFIFGEKSDGVSMIVKQSTFGNVDYVVKYKGEKKEEEKVKKRKKKAKHQQVNSTETADDKGGMTMHFEKCNFLQNKGIFVATYEAINLTILGCYFENSQYSAISLMREEPVDRCNYRAYKLQQKEMSNIEKRYKQKKKEMKKIARQERKQQRQVPEVPVVPEEKTVHESEKAPEKSAKPQISLTLLGSVFNKTNITGCLGGAIFAMQIDRVLIQSTTFLKTESTGNGGALYIKNSNEVVVDKCTFIEAKSGLGGAISMESAGSIHIRNCTFSKCQSEEKGGAIETKYGNIFNITGSIFLGNYALNGGALHIHRTLNVTVASCLFVQNEERKHSTVPMISNCEFRGGGALKIFSSHLLVFNSRFTRNKADGKGGALYFECGKDGDCSATIERSFFEGNIAAVDGGGVSIVKAREQLVICYCVFANNSADSSGGAISSYNTYGKEMAIHMCIFIRNTASIGGATNLVKRTEFAKRNQLQKAFIVSSCLFKNNTATSLGQAVYANVLCIIMNGMFWGSNDYNHVYHIHAITGQMTLQNVSLAIFRNNKNESKTKTNGLLLQSNNVDISDDLKFSCPMNFNPEIENSSYLFANCDDKSRQIVESRYTYFKLGCASCPYNTYSLFNGKLSLPNIDENPIVELQKCVSCPVGGSCDKLVKAVDNYWGYRISETEVQFKLCPLGYCCSAATKPCVHYQTCVDGREGILCGSCQAGFKLSFFGEQCVPIEEECDQQLFIVYVVFYCFVYTILFIAITNLKDIIAYVKQICPLISAREDKDNDEVNVIVQTQLEVTTDQFSLSGFVQIIVLYFQIASLLRVKLQRQSNSAPAQSAKDGEAEDSTMDEIGETFSQFFNFRFTIVQSVCPSDTLTLPEKEALLFGMKMGTFVALIMVFVVFLTCNRLMKAAKSQCTDEEGQRTEKNPTILAKKDESVRFSNGRLVEEHNTSNHLQEPKLKFTDRLKLTFIKLMKLYYMPITKSTLHLIHCVHIKENYHLYVYGDLVCYASWQIAILVVVLPGILLFPVCFELSIRLLKKSQISSTQFVLAIFCPYYAILLHCRKKEEEEKSSLNCEAIVQVILQSEEELFAQMKGCLGWTIVQFYRSLILAFASTFVINPVYRQVILLPILLCFSIHDRDRMPFKNAYLNYLNVLASSCLVIICACNIVPALSYIVDITATPGIFTVLKASAVVEMLLYAAVPLTFPAWKIWGAVKERQKTIK